jgi:hypothetical protein
MVVHQRARNLSAGKDNNVSLRVKKNRWTAREGATKRNPVVLVRSTSSLLPVVIELIISSNGKELNTSVNVSDSLGSTGKVATKPNPVAPGAVVVVPLVVDLVIKAEGKDLQALIVVQNGVDTALVVGDILWGVLSNWGQFLRNRTNSKAHTDQRQQQKALH